MIHEVTMPSMGADMTEGTVVKWLVQEGDPVARGDKLAEIETDKTVVEMEAYNDGILRKIVLGDGAKVPVGTLLAYIGNPEDDVPQNGSAEQTASTPETQTPAQPRPATTSLEPQPQTVSETEIIEISPSTDHESESQDARVKASPIARRLAREHGYDIAKISGTGPGGRITRDDVANYTPQTEPAIQAMPAASAVIPDIADDEPQPTSPTVQIDDSDIQLSSMRQAIARVTLRSKTEAPHYYVTTAIDMTDAMSFRNQLNHQIAQAGDRVSVNDLIIKSLALALAHHPKWNTFFQQDRLQAHDSINIGIAIALEEGLIVPAIIGVENMSLVQISRAAKDIGRRARNQGGTLTQQELTQGTFSTSNLGMFGIDTFAAIIVPPQAGILAVGAVKQTPVVIDGQIVIRQTMNATISADHRVGDGAEAAQLLNTVKEHLEHPLSLIL